ncbi:MAG: pyrimidine 5'-nucleotidase [Anaerolineaceae bacterium]|nr:pyrimidine 5'-nucleotidase [Anaerolineaceae bacterium]
MPFSTLLIDLDETVYSTACGVWEAISRRMEQYMHERLNLSWEEIPELRKSLYQQYGTTLRGLQKTLAIDEQEYVNYVHDVPLDQFLVPDQALRDVLLRYPQQKVIFTNADRNHARRVMQVLQITDCFSDLVDIFDIAPYCKPMPESFQIALARAGETDPGACVFIDDSPHNLAAARALGFYTIQVGSPKPGYRHPPVQAHAHITKLSELEQVLDPETSAHPG